MDYETGPPGELPSPGPDHSIAMGTGEAVDG